MSESFSLPLERIQSRIVVLRGVRVIVDAGLAALYGVPTKRLNEQVKRNHRRFPEDFVFRLTRTEALELARSRSQFATLKRGGNVKYLPFAFTEHGAIQAANVLNSSAAERMGVMVVRAFVQLRLLLANHRALTAKLGELEKRVGAHDADIAALVAAIRRLAAPDAPARRKKRLGFLAVAEAAGREVSRHA